MADSYVAKKLREKHVALNVDGRKNPHSLKYVLSSTPKKLKSGFVELEVGNTAESVEKKRAAAAADAASASARPATRAASVPTDDGALPSGDMHNIIHPFTPAARRGRKPKANAPLDATATAPASVTGKGDDGIARPTPSPPNAAPSLDEIAEYFSPHVTSQDLGVRRLLPEDIMQLKTGDEIALVIPIDGAGEGKQVKSTRASIKADVKSHFASNHSLLKTLTGDALEQRFDANVRDGHIVRREGKSYCEFAATVTNFAHRDDFATWSEQTVNRELRRGGAIGLRFHACDLQIGKAFELKLNDVAAVELWKRRESHEAMTSHITFSKHLKSAETLGTELRHILSMVDGDVTATMEALYKYYREKADVERTNANRAKAKAAKAGDAAATSMATDWKAQLKNELNNDKIRDFCDEADAMWREAIVAHYKNFHYISEELIGEDKYVALYDKMEESFPLHAAAFMNVAIQDLFYQPERFDAGSFKRKKKIALMHFFALTRARNKDNMTHWAMIETLAVFGKGISQVTTRSTTGKNFCTTLKHALGTLDEIYKSCQPEIREIMRREPTIAYVLDNYQKVISKLIQGDNSSAISHRATASLAIRHKVPTLPIGTILRSPSGMRYRFARVTRETPYLLLVTLAFESSGPLSRDEMAMVDDPDMPGTLHRRFMYPSESTQWEIIDVPGLDTARPIAYVGQHVPAMLEFVVPENVVDDELLLESRAVEARAKRVHLDVARYQRLVHRQERITMLSTFCTFMKADEGVKKILQWREHDEEERTKTTDKYDYDGMTAEEAFANDEYSLKATMLMDLFAEASVHVHHAKVFQNDMIRRANPEVGIRDQFHYFPLHDGDETTNEGALRALINAHVEMGMLKEMPGKRYKFAGDGRWIDIFGDQLTEQRMYPMRRLVLKSLTKIGHEDYVEQLIGSLDRQLLQHDYLHETFHQLAAIYNQYYGGFLQPLVCLMGVKRVSGDPLGGGKIIDHHNFAELVYKALARFRCQQFVEKISKDDLRIGDDENPRSFLARVEGMYEEYCRGLETSSNEQTRLCAQFLKKMESYLRCKKGIRKADALLLEAETNDWLGMWRATGKTGYLKAGCRRIENYYYKMKPWLLECHRRNRFPLMNEGKGHMVFDEVCELLMSWLKRFPPTPFLPSVINKSKHVSLIRRCALELWGKGQTQRSCKRASTDNEVKKLVKFFASTRVFDVNEAIVGVDDNTMWAYVNVKKDNEPAGKDARREVVEMKAHEKKLLESLFGEHDMDEGDEGEIDRLLGVTKEEDEESVNVDTTGTRVNCEGVLGELGEEAEEGEDATEDTLCLDTEANRDSVLKRLGSTQHKPFNKQALEDSFARGAERLKDIKAERDKERAKEDKEEERIRKAVAYFVQERNKRRRVMEKQIEKAEAADASDGDMAEWEINYLREREMNE